MPLLAVILLLYFLPRCSFERDAWHSHFSREEGTLQSFVLCHHWCHLHLHFFCQCRSCVSWQLTSELRWRKTMRYGVFLASLKSSVIYWSQRGSCFLAQPGFPLSQAQQQLLCSPLEPSWGLTSPGTPLTCTSQPGQQLLSQQTSQAGKPSSQPLLPARLLCGASLPNN